jgi:hypothetical protein
MHASQCVDLFFLVRFVVSWLDRHGEDFSVFSDGKRLLVLTCANSRPIFDSPAIIPVEAHTRQFKQFRAFVLSNFVRSCKVSKHERSRSPFDTSGRTDVFNP